MKEGFKIIEHYHGGRSVTMNYLCKTEDEAFKILSYLPHGIYQIVKVFIKS